MSVLARSSRRSPLPHLRQHSPAFAHGFAAVRTAVLALAHLVFLPLANAAPAILVKPLTYIISEEEEELPKSPEDPNLWIYLSIALALVLLGGAFAGLTIALMGQDPTYLQVLAESGDKTERKNAAKVQQLLKKGKHWVLVTLLLSNVITNETLPIVLDRSLGGGWPAVLSSTILIFIFGEVLPQSACVRYGLSIGAFMAPFVLLLMWIMAPVSWPAAKLLDWILGEDHGTSYKRAGLKSLVQMHKTLGQTANERLMDDEILIIQSVLDLKEKPVGGIMTPMQDVFTMSADTVLDQTMMNTILSQGYSRIPIYAPDNTRNFIGMLLVKILIPYDPEDCMRVGDFALATLPETAPHTSCLDIINFFQEGKSHMVLVSDFPGQDKGALGVVTLEDVIEELIGEEIIDESDVFVDIHKAIRRIAPAPQARFNKAMIGEALQSDNEVDHKDSSEETPLLGKKSSTDFKSSDGVRRRGIANEQHHATFMMRRKSSAASDSTHSTLKPVPVRSNTADIRQHLKHLGPSNAASKPRATKYTSVKIKPGVSTIPENRTSSEAQAHDVSIAEISRPHTSASNRKFSDAVSVLRAEGGASDGAAAVQASTGYGTLGTSPVTSVGGDKMSAHEASEVAREKASLRPITSYSDADYTSHQHRFTNGEAPDFPAPPRPEKFVFGNPHPPSDRSNRDDDEADENDDEDTIGELNNSSSSQTRPKQRLAARSGSITETTVSSGGMNKMVLETNSSSSISEDSASLSSSRKGSAAAPAPSHSHEDDEDDGEEDDDNGGSVSPQGSDGGHSSSRPGTAIFITKGENDAQAQETPEPEVANGETKGKKKKKPRKKNGKRS